MSSGGDVSPSRNNGFGQILSKARRGQHGKASETSSLVSDSSDSHKGPRSSFDRALGRLKMRDGDDHGGEHNGLSKLIPKDLGNRIRRKKQERADEQRAGEEVARGRTVADRGTLSNEGESHKVRDVDPMPDVDISSQLTNESDDEPISNTTPPSSTHVSHIGYLTTSSPILKSKILPQGVASVVELDKIAYGGLEGAQSSSRSLPTATTATLQAPQDSPVKRSPSPVGRLKEALSPKRGPSPNVSPERNGRSGGGQGVLLKEKNISPTPARRGSVASRMAAMFPDKQVTQAAAPPSSQDKARNGKTLPPINTADRPTTPTTSQGAPVIVNTPPTPSPSTPPQSTLARDRGPSDPPAASSNIVTSASGNMISHRRVRSGSASSVIPSKLSNITSAPLTPMPENGSTTPGTNPQTGFFSSVLSAAQNAAQNATNTLSNSISNTSMGFGPAKNRSVIPDTKAIENVEVETAVDKADTGEVSPQKELAVKTLGMGDLSLSHLGISETPSANSTPVMAKFPEPPEERGRPETTSYDTALSKAAVTPIAVESVEGVSTADLEDAAPMPATVTAPAPVTRPRSTYEPSIPGDHTPPNHSLSDGKNGIGRSTSIRSGLGASSRKARRASGAGATAAAVGAAIAAANASVANLHLQPHISPPKLTGFAVASKKRNRDFHTLFRSVPDDDYLIEDYSCALQREILAHGRLYVSEGHLCFSSNIFGWVTTLVMSFDEIVSVEKRSTALVFKNGLMISTLHAKNVFASFTSRDSTYDLIVGIWKLGHPSLRSSLNGVRIDEPGGGDKTEKDDGHSQSGSGSEDESNDDDVYDEDDEAERMSFSQTDGSKPSSEVGDKHINRKPSGGVPTSNGVEKPKDESPIVSGGDFPGPSAHPPTKCSDQDTHYEKVVADEIIAAPLGKVYNLMFGPASVSWMSKWLTVEQKCLDFTMEDRKGLTNDNKSRTYSFIKPLNGAIGPRQTKCVITETLDALDLEKAVSVTMSTQTPDVPSGNVFTTKTKYCLTWAEGNKTRMQMNCAIEWTGKSWLKGPIEKGANDGQYQYGKDLTAALRAAVSTRARAGTGGSKKKKSRKAHRSSPGKVDGASDSKSVKREDWGLLEPLHDILGPFIDIFKPLINGNMVYGLLVGLLVAAWFSFGRMGGGKDVGFYGTPERIAAYEEIWRREESELWNWLDERVGMERMTILNGREESKNMEEKLREEKVNEREVDIAIQVTEEKLRVLKGVVEKKRASMAATPAELQGAAEKKGSMSAAPVELP